MKVHSVVSDEPMISMQAWMFRWRRMQRWARLHPEQAAVMTAEKLVSR